MNSSKTVYIYSSSPGSSFISAALAWIFLGLRTWGILCELCKFLFMLNWGTRILQYLSHTPVLKHGIVPISILHRVFWCPILWLVMFISAAICGVCSYDLRYTAFMCIFREMGDPTKRKPYLPSEKQFLITRNGNIILTLSLISRHRI